MLRASPQHPPRGWYDGWAPGVSTIPHTLLTRDKDVAALCARLARVESFAFDTEFVGEDQYEPEICLVQVATDEECALIDPLSGVDLSEFWHLVGDDGVCKIVHAGSEDIAICRRLGRCDPCNVFDLQVAAGMIGLGFPASLAKLAKAVAGVAMHKSQTLTNWRKRPLSAEQLDYAAADVAFLPRMHATIRQRLRSRKREAWAIEESQRMCSNSIRIIEPDDQRRRLKGAGSLSRRELAIVDAILAERDAIARERNRPPRTVLKDFLVIELAKRGWTEPSKLATLRGMSLPQAILKRLGSAIDRARSAPPESHPPALPSREHSEEEEIILSLLTGILRDHCRQNALAYSLLASRSDLKDYARSVISGDASGPVLLRTGWRHEAVGKLLDAVLSGRSVVRIRPENGEFHVHIE